MTTRRTAYLVGTLVLLVVGAVVAYKAFGHVRVRVENWTNPWPNAQGTGIQPVQGWYALGSGGIAGTGLGLGQPWRVPLASTDYMFTSIGEELGLVGSIGVIAAFMLFVGSSYPHRGRRGPPVHEALRGRHRDDHRPAVVPHHRRRDPGHPAHRHHPPVRVLRRFVARRELRPAGDPPAHLRRSGPHERAGSAAGDTMNVGIRRIGIAIIVLFVVLVAQLTYLQVGRSSQLANASGQPAQVLRRHPARPRADRDRRRRGRRAFVADRRRVQVPARVPGGYRDDVRRHRRVPVDPARVGRRRGQLLVRSRGAHAQAPGEQPRRRVREQAARRHRRVDDVRSRAGGRRVRAAGHAGAAWSCSTCRPVACSPPTPTRRTTRTCLSSHDTKKAQAAYTLLTNAPDNPLLSRSWRELYPPGSTFKTVTASIALAEQHRRRQEVPGAQRDRAAPDERRHARQLRQGEMRRISARRLHRVVQHDLRAGRPRPRRELSRPVSRTSASTHPPPARTARASSPRSSRARAPTPARSSTTSRSSCRTRSARTRSRSRRWRWHSSPRRSRTRVSILQPHFVDCVLDPNDKVVSRVGVQQYKRAIDPADRGDDDDLHASGREQSTRNRHRRADPRRKGRGQDRDRRDRRRGRSRTRGSSPSPPADHPKYAIAVLVEHGGSASAEVTGGRVAAPIAKQVLQTLLNTKAAASPCGGQPVSPSNGG